MTSSTEFNIFNLFNILWKKRILIISVSFIFFLTSVIYVQFLRTVIFQGNLELKPTSQEFLAKFKYLNRKEAVGIEITDEKLMNEFLNIFQDYEILKTNISKEILFDEKEFDNQYQYNDFIKSYAFNFDIEIEEGKKFQKTFLTYITDDTQQSENIISATLEEIKASQAEKLKREIQNLFDAEIFAIQQEYRKTEDEIDLKIFHYEISLNNQIEFLKEQAEIARELSISQNQFDYISQIDTNAENTNGIILGELPYYNRGYIAIEKEIELLSNRLNVEDFIEGLPDLLQKKKKLEIQELRSKEENSKIISNLRLDTIEFEPVQYDLSLITYDIISLDKRLIVILSLLLGFFVIITYVIITDAYRKFNQT